MRVTRNRHTRTLKLDQEVYVHRLLQQYNMDNCTPAPTPELERPSQLARSSAASAVSHSHDHTGPGAVHTHSFGSSTYGSLVGALLYAALCTRPDIAHAVNMLSRAISNPSEAHLAAAKHLLRYLSGTASLGLTYTCMQTNSANLLVPSSVTLAPTFCDADWGGDLATRRSTSGVIVKVNGCTVSWMSKRQAVVSLSSAEAEYMAMGSAVQEIIWLRALLSELGWPQTSAPTVLQCDNQSAIALAADDLFHSRTKHIDIRHHFLREHVRVSTVALRWVPTADQEADILTKAIGRLLFNKLRAKVLGGIQV